MTNSVDGLDMFMNDYWIAISRTLLVWMIHLFWGFFVYLLLLKNIPTLKIKVCNTQNWMPKWIFKMVKSCVWKMVRRTHLLNSKMVKHSLGRSNSNFGSNKLTSMVDMPYRIIIGKFQLLKQGFGFIVHTRIF